MNLHLDQQAFRVLLEDIHGKTGYRMDVLEKDYYVVLILSELAQMQQDGLPACFKGGTALYKALKTTKRFSEDIDLSVDTRECSRTQNDKRLERATKKFKSLPRDAAQGKTNRSEVVSVYHYDPVTGYDADDALQRFGKVKIEAASFTISEPFDDMEVSPLLYDLASDEQKTILRQNYGVVPFPVQTITLERIFVDKLFAAEAYVRGADKTNRAFEAAKHIYDLAVMVEHPQIELMLADPAQIKRLLKIRLEEEWGRLDGVPGVSPKDFVFFTQATRHGNIRRAYETMQNQYVLRSVDRIEFEAAMAALQAIHERLLQNPAWTQARVSATAQLKRSAAEKNGRPLPQKSSKREREPER